MSNDFIFYERNKIKIKADLAFSSLYPLLSKPDSINQVSNEIAESVINISQEKYGRQPTTGSLNNCKGRWNELSFLVNAHESILEMTDNLYVVKMGTETSIKFWEIYTPEARKNFESLLKQLQTKNIFLRCSTPDFVVIKRQQFQNEIRESNKRLEDLTSFYFKIKNRCHPADVLGFISLKTSNRPDRRYQILYEANITKYASQYIHDRNFPLRFDAIGVNNKSDREVFNAPVLTTLKKINLKRLNEELKSIDFPVIDSEEQIPTRSDLDNYWQRFGISNNS